MEQREIDKLLVKFFNHELDNHERKMIEQWILDSAENRKKFEEYKKLFELIDDYKPISDLHEEDALIEIKKQIPGFRKVRKMQYTIMRIAAVLVLAIGIFWIFQHKPNAFFSKTEIVLQETVAPSGEPTQVNLSDGSVAYLYPGSTLRYPQEFNGDSRIVEMDGEGYFEVFHDEDKPFYVKTEGMNVKVLGTEFNVIARDEIVEVVLVNGKVSIEHEENDESTILATLKPNDHSIYNVSDHSVKVIQETELEKYVSWHNGRLVFDADPFEDVVEKLEDWFDVDIVIANEQLKTYQLTCAFKNETVEEVMTLLQFSTPFKYEIKEENNKKSIVLSE